MSGCPVGGGRDDAAAGFSRRAFLRGTATGAVIAAGVPTGFAGGAILAGSQAAAAATTGAVPFHGAHQGGILTSPNRAHSVVSLDLVTDDRADLVDFFQTLTAQVRDLVAGGPVTEAFSAGIASDSGMLGPVVPARHLTATVSVGASLFDDRYGLAPRKPAYLSNMLSFPNDDLDQTRCHGDLNVTLQAADVDTVTHALRRIMQATDGVAQPRWRLDGFVNPPRPSGVPQSVRIQRWRLQPRHRRSGPDGRPGRVLGPGLGRGTGAGAATAVPRSGPTMSTTRLTSLPTPGVSPRPCRPISGSPTPAPPPPRTAGFSAGPSTTTAAWTSTETWTWA